MGTGLLFFLLGIVLILEGNTPDGSSLSSILSIARNVIMIGGTIGIGLLVKGIKTKLTYPRTGYIAYPQPKGKKLGFYIVFGLIFAFVVSGGMLFILMYIPAVQKMIIYLPTWLLVWLGIFIASVYLTRGIRTGLFRFFGLAGIGLITSFVLAYMGRGQTLLNGKTYLAIGPGIFFVIMSFCLFVSGVVTLRNYLQSNQPINGEAT
jgi:hypothetical protein